MRRRRMVEGYAMRPLEYRKPAAARGAVPSTPDCVGGPPPRERGGDWTSPMRRGIDTRVTKPPRRTVVRARKLRRAMSIPETTLWVRLRARPAGFKFRRQHPCGPYVLDFYCAAAKLAIEVDGVAHDMGDRPEHDARRERSLNGQGIEIMRIRAGDIVRDVDAAVGAIVVISAARRIPLHHPALPDGPLP